MKPLKSKLPFIRLAIQIGILTFLFIGFLTRLLPEVHNICPMGGAEGLFKLATTGHFLQKTNSAALILFILSLVITLLFGAIFCGFICPFGTLQELIGRIGKKLFPNIHNKVLIPKKLDNALRYLRYAVLAFILIQTALVGKMIFEGFDPYFAFMNILNKEVTQLALVLLAIVMVSSLFTERPFCKYACPYGAILGAVGKLAVFKVHRNKTTCVDCKKCDNVCPMNIEISKTTKISSHQCVMCLRCTSDEACPVKNTVYIAGGKGEKNV